MVAALSFFAGVDRTVVGHEGLVQAQFPIADDGTKDAFGHSSLAALGGT
jgi:type I restriction enzyme, R subunit